MSVEKVGRTTGHTQGEIVSAKFSTKISYPMGMLTFRNQIRTTSMSRPGDSGSCLIERGTRNPVGLLFAGSDTASYCNPMREVLSALSSPHTYKYPSGATYHFSSDHSLRILQKRSYATALISDRESVACAQTLRSLPVRYRIAATVAGVGLCATAMKLAGLVRPARQSETSNTSSFFFRSAPVQASAGTVHKSSIELGL